jgi:tRNA nucleotidyltransferase (CCA-adding enzyme)
MKTPLSYAIMRGMTQPSLATKLKKVLPAELVDFIETAARLATEKGQKLYLVGGVVRDLLLEEPNSDLDLVIEGDAVELAQHLAELKQVKITTHPHFMTAKLTWGDFSVDFTTARSETYAKPGALPTVKPGSIEDDLFRRDFTINAMAICLNTHRYGELIDRHGGQSDLEHRLIRVLHEKSFTDDATRIWRGLRYEQRLDFQLEETTLHLLKRDIPMLNTISGDRIRYELECIFSEAEPEKVLRRADELGVLERLHPTLKGNNQLTRNFEKARKQLSPKLPPIGLYLALLTYQLGSQECDKLISYLRLPKALGQTVHDAAVLKDKLKMLAYPELSASYVYRILHRFSPAAITAISLATASPIARQHLEIYLHRLRYVKPALKGADLLTMGITPGPRVREVLTRLHEAKLDGKAVTRQDEEALIREWLANKT